MAITAGEMKDPRRTVKRSVNPLFWRMFLFYIGNIWLAGMWVPFNHPDLSESETLSSPFIVAIRDGGAPIFAHIINGLVFITVLSCGVTSYYVASRCFCHISDLGIIHPVLWGQGCCWSAVAVADYQRCFGGRFDVFEPE